jgi:ribose 5-phosphate isomerase RpiB
MRIAMGAITPDSNPKQAVKQQLRRRTRCRGRRHRIGRVGRLPAFRRRGRQAVARERPSAASSSAAPGNGVAIVANKVDGIRAVNAHDVAEAEMARRHNNINVDLPASALTPMRPVRSSPSS